MELTGDGASIKGYQESGTGTIAKPDTSGFIACGNAGCTTVKNPNQATSKINYVHIEGMALTATGANSKVIDMTSIGHSDIKLRREFMRANPALRPPSTRTHREATT